MDDNYDPSAWEPTEERRKLFAEMVGRISQKRKRLIEEVRQIVPLHEEMPLTFAEKVYGRRTGVGISVHPLYTNDKGELFAAKMGRDEEGNQYIISLHPIKPDSEGIFPATWFTRGL